MNSSMACHLFSKNAEQLHDIFIDEVLGCTAPLSAGGQRDSFNLLVEETLGEECQYDTVVNIHEKLNEIIEAQKDSPDPVELTKSEVKRLFEDCGVEEEKLETFDAQYEAVAGEKASLMASNITNTRSLRSNAGCGDPCGARKGRTGRNQDH